MSDMLSFHLPDSFIEGYADKKPNWGFPIGAGDSLAELIYVDKYSALKEDGTKEQWHETVRRCVEGYYSILKDHCRRNRTPWNDFKALSSAKDAYDRMWNFKWLPPGRGLQHMGRPIVHEEGHSSALQNCAFLSTSKLSSHSVEEATLPFTRMMEMSMWGVGVGYDLKGEGNLTLHEPNPDKTEIFVVPDHREGWAESVGKLLESYFFKNRATVEFDYSEVRPAGAALKRFGGRASGPGPLITLHDSLRSQLDKRGGETITSRDILDIMNKTGKAVVAGGARRSAQICFGDPTDSDYVNAKNWNLPENAERTDPENGWAWNSNNSVFVEEGDDYSAMVEGILTNGEPGFMWLDLARSHGRLVDARNDKDWRVAGGNPCLEQSLEDKELCVRGNTKIHTYNGVYEIADIVGEEVRIFNGESWSTVKPFETGEANLYRVHLSDGSYLDVTGGHKWLARTPTATKMREVKTTDLLPGMYLPEFSLSPSNGGNREKTAYTMGWVAGDGFIDGNRTLALVQEPEYAIIADLGGVAYPEQQPDGYAKPFRRVNVTESVDINTGKALRDHESGLPSVVMNMDSESLSEFFGGWIDTDGSLIKNPNTDHYVLYGSEAKLRDAQILLRRIGVNHASVKLFKPKGHETNYGIRNYDLYRLLIPSYEASAIETRLKMATRFGSRFAKNNAHEKSAMIDRARKQKVLYVENLNVTEMTYCFDESELHQGVFGNVLTKQCTLVEVFPSKHSDYEDFRESLKHAYLYGKAVTLLPTKWADSNEVMARNRRIGCSISGLAEFVETKGWAELRRWADEGYGFIEHRDEKYSEWLAVRESIKKTSIKPSGTVSLVAGVTPGVHWPTASGSYIRRVRYSVNSPLVEHLRKAGYDIEPAQGDPENTVVATFITKGPDVRDERSVTIWEKAELAAMMQRWWADNQVSATITFLPEERDQLLPPLASKDGQFKGVSFLPLGDEETYPQQPYEKLDLTEKEIEKKMKSYKSLGNLYAVGVEAGGDKFCDTDQCSIL